MKRNTQTISIQTRVSPSLLAKLASYYYLHNKIITTKSGLIERALRDYVKLLGEQGLLEVSSVDEERSLLQQLGFSNPALLDSIKKEDANSVSSESLQAALAKLKEL